MRGFIFTIGLVVAARVLSAQPEPAHNPVLGVVTGSKPFSIGSVEEKPETGPIVVVDGDKVYSPASAPLMFRLTGENRAVLAGNSVTRVRPLREQNEDGAYFYLNKGAIQYDARKEPLAICARDRLYVPSRPGSGQVVIGENNKVEVILTTGTMVRSGSDVCGEKAAPLWLSGGTGGAGGTATATATATGLPVVTGAPLRVAIGVGVAMAAGVVGATSFAQAPAPQSQTAPSP